MEKIVLEPQDALVVPVGLRNRAIRSREVVPRVLERRLVVLCEGSRAQLMPRLEINMRRRAFMQDVRGDRHRVGQKLPQRAGGAVAVRDVESAHAVPFLVFCAGPTPRTRHRSLLARGAGSQRPAIIYI